MSARQVDPAAVSIGNFLRKNELLKQRQGLLQGGPVDFFRFKRAARALLSDAYKKKQENPKNNLPLIKDDADAKKAFIMLIQNQFVRPVAKLSSAQAREKGFSPKKDKPTLDTIDKAELKPDEYYIWLYTPKSTWEYVMGFGIVAAIFALILFPLWPYFMRKGVWYLSMILLGLIGLFFVIAIIRLIIFTITYVVLKPGLWIFPNLFEDVGFVDSFIPLYEWNHPKEKKSKKPKKKTAAQSPLETIPSNKNTISAATSAATTSAAKPNESTNTRRKATLEEVEE